jgi:hypothetical protein
LHRDFPFHPTFSKRTHTNSQSVATERTDQATMALERLAPKLAKRKLDELADNEQMVCVDDAWVTSGSAPVQLAWIGGPQPTPATDTGSAQSNSLYDRLMQGFLNNAPVIHKSKQARDRSITTNVKKQKTTASPPVAASSSSSSSVQSVATNHRQKTAAKSSSIDMAKTTVVDRIAQFPGQGLVSRNGQLHCNWCAIHVGMKKSLVKQHVNTPAHIRKGSEKAADIAAAEKQFRPIIEELKARAAETRQSFRGLGGVQVPEEAMLHRMRVADVWVEAGIPFQKIRDYPRLRRLLEGPEELRVPWDLGSTVTHIAQVERTEVLAELAQADWVAVLHDATRRTAEAFCVVVRFSIKNKAGLRRVTQRVLDLSLLQKNLTGQEIATHLVKVLQQSNVQLATVLAWTRDTVAANDVASRTVQGLQHGPRGVLSVDVGCWCHFLSSASQTLELGLLDEFTAKWVALISSSQQAKDYFKSKAGRMPSKQHKVCTTGCMNGVSSA